MKTKARSTQTISLRIRRHHSLRSLEITLLMITFIFCLALVNSRAITTIECDQTIQGTISSASQIDQYQFSGQSGQTVLVTVYGVWPNGCCNTHYAVGTIYDPNGKVVGTCENTPTTLSLTNTGTYLILVNADNYSTTGSYGINLSFDPSKCGPELTWGKTTAGSLTGLAETDTYTFYAQSNAIVLLTATGVWPNGCCDTHYAVGDIYDPNGKYVTSCENTTTAPLTLTNTGYYTFLVHADDYERTGSYSLGLSFIRFAGTPFMSSGTTNGAAFLGLYGVVGTATTLQYTTNMIGVVNEAWFPMTNFNLPWSPYQYVDWSSTNVSQRFYRTVQ